MTREEINEKTKEYLNILMDERKLAHCKLDRIGRIIHLQSKPLSTKAGNISYTNC